MSVKLFFLRSIFAFIVLLMPVIALQPPGPNAFEVTDFFSYYSQAKLLAEKPQQDVYDPVKLVDRARQMYEPLKTHGPYYVGELPMSLTFMLPVAVLPQEHALIIFKIILVLATAFSMTLLAVAFDQSERQFLGTIVAVAMSGPFWEATRVTKPGLLVLLAFSLSLVFLKKNKTLLASVLLLPWTIRPQAFLTFFAQCLGAGKWKFLLCVAATTIALFLISLPIFGLDNYKSWANYMQYMSTHLEITAPFLHPTLRGQLMRFAGIPPGATNAVYLCAFGLTLLFSLVSGYRFKNSPDWLKQFTACMPLGIVAGPYCHNYDIVLLIPAVIAFFKLRALNSLPLPAKIAIWTVIGLCLLCFEMPIYDRIHYDYLQRNIWTVSPLFISLFILSLTFAVFAWKDGNAATKA